MSPIPRTGRATKPNLIGAHSLRARVRFFQTFSTGNSTSLSVVTNGLARKRTVSVKKDAKKAIKGKAYRRTKGYVATVARNEGQLERENYTHKEQTNGKKTDDR